MTRKFFDKPLDSIALDYHPQPVDAYEFTQEMLDNLPAFLANMKSLKIDGQKKYPEQWMQTFLAWMEFNCEKDT